MVVLLQVYMTIFEKFAVSPRPNFLLYHFKCGKWCNAQWKVWKSLLALQKIESNFFSAMRVRLFFLLDHGLLWIKCCIIFIGVFLIGHWLLFIKPAVVLHHGSLRLTTNFTPLPVFFPSTTHLFSASSQPFFKSSVRDRVSSLVTYEDEHIILKSPVTLLTLVLNWGALSLHTSLSEAVCWIISQPSSPLSSWLTWWRWVFNI